MSITIDQKTERLVAEEVRSAAANFRNLILGNLAEAGEQAVNVARSVVTAEGYAGSGTPYKVQTGNLVSSVGYCITEDGIIVQMSSFDAVQGKEGNGAQGAMTGKQLAMQVASNYPQGYALIIVAGMHYASYVQEIHHRDVLASATLIATKLVNELKAKINQ